MIDVHVGDIMRRDVDRVEPDSPVEAVVEKLRERRVSCVVVCEGDNPVGLVSLKDAVGALADAPAGQRARTAADVMSAPLRTIASTQSAADAASAVMSYALRQLPVVDARGSLVGLIGEDDLLRAYARRNEQLHELSTVDPVTGLRTRRCITDVLSAEWQRARRYGRPRDQLGGGPVHGCGPRTCALVYQADRPG